MFKDITHPKPFTGNCAYNCHIQKQFYKSVHDTIFTVNVKQNCQYPVIMSLKHQIIS